MSDDRLWEPNPVPGRLLTVKYLTELGESLDRRATLGRCHGLLAPVSGGAPALPFLDPPDVLCLRTIRAIGVQGYPILADRNTTESFIAPLDTLSLPVGTHRIYACLSRDKVPCGDVFEDPGPDGGPGARGRTHRCDRVVLEPEGRHLVHRDWLPVAIVERVRSGGSVRTLLDERFHPPIADMRAYFRPNPLVLLAKKALQALELQDPSGGLSLLKVELSTLLNIAERATPLEALIQAQRCLGLIRLEAEPPLLLDGRLEGHRFDPDAFCAFLSNLAESLEQGTELPYPPTLEIEDVTYTKLSGELLEDQEFWIWATEREKFMANGLAVYLPHSTRGTLPVVRYGWKRLDNGDFQVAGTAKRIKGPGSAILLHEIRNPLPKLYLTVGAEMLRQKLRHQLGDGHALYYF